MCLLAPSHALTNGCRCACLLRAQHLEEAQQRIASLEAQLSAAYATMQQQHAENEQLRMRCAQLEHHVRGSYGDSGY